MTILDIFLERETSLKLATESLRIAITWTLLLFIIKTVYKITTVLCDTLQLLCTADFAHLQIFLHPDIAKGPPNPSIIFLSLKLCFSCVSGLLTIFHPSRTRLLICKIIHVLWAKIFVMCVTKTTSNIFLLDNFAFRYLSSNREKTGANCGANPFHLMRKQLDGYNPKRLYYGVGYFSAFQKSEKILKFRICFGTYF